MRTLGLSSLLARRAPVCPSVAARHDAPRVACSVFRPRLPAAVQGCCPATARARPGNLDTPALAVHASISSDRLRASFGPFPADPAACILQGTNPTSGPEATWHCVWGPAPSPSHARLQKGPPSVTEVLPATSCVRRLPRSPCHASAACFPSWQFQCDHCSL